MPRLFFFSNFCGTHCGQQGRRGSLRHCSECHAIKREKAAFNAASAPAKPTPMAQA